MADENKDLQTEDTSAPADETTAPATVAGAPEPMHAEAEGSEPASVPDATGDDGQQSLPGLEGDAAPKPEDAAGETSSAGAQDSAASDTDPTTPAPAADEDPGISAMPTPDAAALSDAPADTSAPAGPDATPPAQTPTADEGTDAAEAAPTVSDVASPEAAAPAEDPATSTSTGIGGDKAADVTPPEAPKQQAAPAPSPAPSSPGLFDHGTPINLPDMSIPSDQGYPIAQPDAPPVHPQGFHPLINDGVGEDAGKAAAPPEYPMPAGAVEVVSDNASAGHDLAAEPAEEPEQPSADAGEPSAVPPHVEGRLQQLFDKVASIETNISKLLHELLD